MAFTPFNIAIGTRQGRIQPEGFDPSSGNFAYVLGSDLSGHIHDFEIGDYAELRQDVDLTADNLIRACLRLRNAGIVPSGVNWEASITVDGVKMTRMIVPVDRTRDRADMRANVSKLTGVHAVALRLELVTD